MSREPRPSLVRCSGPCGHDVDAGEAREAQFAWCLPHKRYADPDRRGGTHTDPQEIHRTGVYLCRSCWARRKGKIRSRTLWPFLDRVAMTLRQLTQMWIDPPGDVQHDLFGNEERKVG